jgi:hypothetical protein
MKTSFLINNVNNAVNNIYAYQFNWKGKFLFLLKFNAMTDRSTNLNQIRPIISSALIYDTMSTDERFQNITLRPVIKLQNELFIEVFKNYVSKHKNVFYELSLSKQLDYIENAIHKDMKFRNSLKGMVIGQFTIEEYEIYIKNSSDLNKRMMNLVKERLVDHIQLLAAKVA